MTEQPTYENGIWKGPQDIFPENYHQIGETLLKNLRDSPDFIGRIDAATGKEETFGSIADKSIRCALWLKKQGIKPGDVVAYCSKNYLNSCIPVFASAYIQAIFNPWWNSCLEEDLVEYFIELTEPKVVFADEESAKLIIKCLPKIKQNIKIILLEKNNGRELLSLDDILNQQNSREVKEFECTKVKDPSAPIAILYTSGTTGRPKGAIHTYGSIRIAISFDATDNKNPKIDTCFSPLCWVTGFISTFRSIILKSTLIIHNCMDEEEACKMIENYKINSIFIGTGVANRLYKTKAVTNYNLSSVEKVMFSGAIMKKEVEDFIRKLFSNSFLIAIYGCTEFGAATAGVIMPDKTTSSGKVYRNSELKIIDPETNEILGANQEGEFCFRGKTMMAGYWKNPEATREAIDQEGWYHSGDLGYYDDDGCVFIIERFKELIKYRLHHVPPAAIEKVIQDHPDVMEVGVVAKPNYEDIEQATAFIKKHPGAKITENEILNLVKKNLHERMWLRGGVYFLEKMPYTASGKISKKDLRALAKKQANFD